jgi:Flp pilus assembly protein TadG
MKKFLTNNRGGAAVEFSLVVLPVLLFIFGIMQTGWIVWTGNLLQSSVDAAARCGGVGSTTVPCYGPTTANMIQTANEVFRPMSGATFAANGSGCASGTGLVGTYTVTFIFVVNMTVTAKSCYPVLS